ncbi:hypothetical protein EV562_10177 [Streptomyces sp. BK208]|uniref:hypothetical protein n=1 Tax=Streptomyces sp. BK208 TaxID=2512150 RepID=UPI00105E542E|nr:hypothetical protein [Streptomyces sp. BK208]TDT42108.1 hypothetical protein EV562_10177 [Streptomyces sp. BK208]
MITRSDITSALDAVGITFSLVEHEEARTTAEADAFIEGYEGVRTKSLFLINRKRTAWPAPSAPSFSTKVPKTPPPPHRPTGAGGCAQSPASSAGRLRDEAKGSSRARR